MQGGYSSRQLKIGSFDELVYQVSDLYVPGRGIVVVPGYLATVPGGSASRGAWTYGAQLGYDVQLQRMVLGIEGDVVGGSQSLSQSSSQPTFLTALSPAGTVTFTRSARASLSWSARARIGYLPSDRLMVYATGGLAGAQVRLKAQDTFAEPGGLGAPNFGAPGCSQPDYNPTNCPGTAQFGPSGPVVTEGRQSKMQLGWTIGGGAEVRLSRRLSLGLEYRYSDYGHKTYSFPDAAVTSQGATITDSRGNIGLGGQAVPSDTPVGLSENRVMVRMNWRFGPLF